MASMADPIGHEVWTMTEQLSKTTTDYETMRRCFNKLVKRETAEARSS